MAEEEKIIEGVENAVEEAVVKEAEVIEEIKEEIKDEAAEAKEARKEKFEEIKSEAKEKVEEAKEKAEEVKEKIKEKVEEAKAAAKEDDDDVYDEADIKNNKVMAILAYLGILVLIPLFAAKESKFARFHTNQGLILFIIALVCSACAKIKLIGWVFGFVDLAVFIFAIMGIIYACKGECKELPIIGKYRFIK